MCFIVIKYQIAMSRMYPLLFFHKKDNLNYYQITVKILNMLYKHYKNAINGLQSLVRVGY